MLRVTTAIVSTTVISSALVIAFAVQAMAGECYIRGKRGRTCGPLEMYCCVAK